MSRGTTLTLYKKYNMKMDDKKFDSIVKKYAEYNKKNDWSKDKKPIEEYKKDIPIMMNINPFETSSVYDEKTKDWIDPRPPMSIDLLRKDVIGYVDSRDKMYCESMMEWSFGSSFDCLVERFNLGHYDFSGCVMEITQDMAEEMLSAINYILGGNWDDNIERGMNNSYIKTFTEGGNCDSYWKYVYRHKNKLKQKTFKIKENGFDITIKCPIEKKNKNAEDDDYYYENELNESNEVVEYALDNFRNGLISFLKSDNWDRHDDNKEWLGYDKRHEYKYVLTYEFWG